MDQDTKVVSNELVVTVKAADAVAGPHLSRPGSNTAAGDSVWPEENGVYTATGTGYDLSMVNLAATGNPVLVREAEFWAEAGAIPGLLLNAVHRVIRWGETAAFRILLQGVGTPGSNIELSKSGSRMTPSDEGVITQPVAFAEETWVKLKVVLNRARLRYIMVAQRNRC